MSACTAACTAGWSPGRRSHCRGCCQNFSVVSNFDKHLDRRGDKIACLDPAEAGLVMNGRGTWTLPGEEDIRERLSSKTA